MEDVDGTNSENYQKNRADEEKACRFKSENEIRKGHFPNTQEIQVPVVWLYLFAAPW